MEKTLHVERLLDLISQEEVILFAGAGLSKYAGYPMGAQLQNIFYSSLSDIAKKEIESTRPLIDLTDDIFHLHQSNNQIIRILKEHYTKAPEKTFVHDIIATIPHFKTIITTNYDGLFEGAFKGNCEVLYNNSHISLADPKKILVYKIHGDLQDSNSIIIKRTDYTNFFNPVSQNSVFWNSVKDKMSSNNILFIGYSLEDSNIDFIFTDILRQLGESKKEVFFVAPSLTQAKKNKLSSYGINFIEGTGEELFPLIFEHINENILLDLKSRKVSTDTTYKFTEKLGYNLSVGTNAASDFFIERIEKINGSLEQKIKFTTKNNQSFILALKNFIDGQTTEKSFRIPKGELLDLVMKVDNFKFQDLSEIKFLDIMKLPSYEGKIDIIFEDGMSLLDFNIKVYKDIIEDKIILSFETDVAKGTIKFEDSNISYESELRETIENPRIVFDYFKSFASIIRGTRFSILVDGKSIFSKKLIEKKIPEDLEFYIDYFEKLFKVESLYLVRFKNIKRNEIDEDNYHKIKCLIAKSENVFIDMPLPSLKAVLDHSFDKGFLNINIEEHLLFFGENTETKINLHGNDFTLGYMRSFVFDPVILNMKEIESGEANVVEVNSKSGKRKVAYYDTYEIPN
ncbi:SIR2 family NAD-dependent protein deacylase [Chryseobacterium indologenes]|uniref:SIR2 family NAD-dependent protein deacylase n=1 Tax=Chryseobacterium indologenes TaxID=253 RepID=UPI001023F9B9|nr:SIR2 family protein [Chryseobacterium indologenes]VFA41469.1 Uncharacterised protein [Chryseobacterium indologenes]